MQETCNNCFGLKMHSMTLRQAKTSKHKCFPILMSIVLYLFASNLSNELNFLKSLALCWDYNPSVIDKALDKFKKPKHSVCHSDLSLNPVVLLFIL